MDDGIERPYLEELSKRFDNPEQAFYFLDSIANSCFDTHTKKRDVLSGVEHLVSSAIPFKGKVQMQILMILDRVYSGVSVSKEDLTLRAGKLKRRLDEYTSKRSLLPSMPLIQRMIDEELNGESEPSDGRYGLVKRTEGQREGIFKTSVESD